MVARSLMPPPKTKSEDKSRKQTSATATIADAQTVTDVGDDESDATASWRDGVETIELGDSIGCRIYQRGTLDRFLNFNQADYDAYLAAEKVPYRRWLFWREAGSSGPWLPQLNDETANGGPRPDIASLGVFGHSELGTTSRACLDDFIALMQSATPKAATASANGPKVQLPH